MARRRRDTFEPVLELLIVTPGLRVFAIVAVVLVFVGGVTVGVVLGLNHVMGAGL